MDAKTEELRAAHNVLAEFYADRLAGAQDRMPAERAVLGLFCESVRAAGLGRSVGDIGCGTGRLEPYLGARGLSPRGIDLSPEMIRVARLTGGKFYTPATASALLGDLPRPQKVPLDTDPPIPLWNTWPVLAAFLALITMEWVIRKRKQMV